MRTYRIKELKFKCGKISIIIYLSWLNKFHCIVMNFFLRMVWIKIKIGLEIIINHDVKFYINMHSYILEKSS